MKLVGKVLFSGIAPKLDTSAAAMEVMWSAVMKVMWSAKINVMWSTEEHIDRKH